MLSCPCGNGRIGSFLLAAVIYCLSVTGMQAMLAQVQHGTPDGVVWLLTGVVGLGFLFAGIASALSHDDAFRPESFLWSVGVIAFCTYALLHGCVPAGSVHDQHVARGFFYAWAASNAFNIWLQLRGVFGHRQSAAPVWQPQQSRLPTGMTTEWLEEIEVHGVNAGYALPAGLSAMPFPAAPPMVEQIGAMPQIAYVKQGDALIPVQLTDARPMQRRLR